MPSGRVKWFNNAKGWGFIEGEAGSDIFVHYSQINGEGFRTLREGDVVEFELKDGPRGQFAERVILTQESQGIRESGFVIKDDSMVASRSA